MSEQFIPARPNNLSKAFWGRYFERSLKRHFHRCIVCGEEHLHSAMARGSSAPYPTIIACTHASWWDAVVTIVMSLRTYMLDADGMMELKQLRKYRFFSGIGMFSVVRENPRGALRSLSYACSRLKNSNRMLWMFPQGTLIHQDLSIACDPGIGILAKKLGRVTIVPLALRYEMLRDQHPTCWARFGNPIEVIWGEHSTIEDVTLSVTNALTMASALLRADAKYEDDSAYRPFIIGRRSLGNS